MFWVGLVLGLVGGLVVGFIAGAWMVAAATENIWKDKIGVERGDDV